jgi:ParB family transcriptional regulator, chromosome partitioning protein
VFHRLMEMKETQVATVAAFVMADTLAVGSVAAETAGVALKADAKAIWMPDQTFFDLIREKATLAAMVEEVAGRDVAKGNAGEKAATQKRIVQDALAGRNGRKKPIKWLPRWMAFPFQSYGKGACALADTAAQARKLAKAS